MFDWQTIATALIILAACIYVARRAWARLNALLRSPGARGGGIASSCATGCGQCGDDRGPSSASPTKKVLVQISGAKAGRRRQ